MLGISLRATNSNEDLRLEIVYDQPNNDFSTVILGKYSGKDIQIDFNSLSLDDMQDLVDFIQLRLDRAKKIQRETAMLAKPETIYRQGDSFPPGAPPLPPVPQAPVSSQREKPEVYKGNDEPMPPAPPVRIIGANGP